MSKRGALMALCLMAAVLCGCASRGSDFARKQAALGGEFLFTTEVLIDQASDADVAWQVGEYASLLAKRNIAARRRPAAEPLRAALKVTQRSYVHRLSIKTSIYGELCVRDQEGGVLFMRTYYHLGTATILSAKTQEKVVRQLLTKALRKQRRSVA